MSATPPQRRDALRDRALNLDDIPDEGDKLKEAFAQIKWVARLRLIKAMTESPLIATNMELRDVFRCARIVARDLKAETKGVVMVNSWLKQEAQRLWKELDAE